MQTYESKIGTKKLVIEYDIKEKEAYMEYVYYEPEYIKAFILLLDTSIQDLISKKVETLVQTIHSTDWIYLKSNNKWTVRSENKDIGTMCIQCKITDAIECILHGLGAK